jgi:hypothetical protein
MRKSRYYSTLRIGELFSRTLAGISGQTDEPIQETPKVRQLSKTHQQISVQVKSSINPEDVSSD